MTPGQDTTTSDESSEVEVNKYHTYIQLRYGDQNFYMNRERHSATSSEKGIAVFNDRRRVDQIATESTLSPLSIHTCEVLTAVDIAELLETEFSINLFV